MLTTIAEFENAYCIKKSIQVFLMTKRHCSAQTVPIPHQLISKISFQLANDKCKCYNRISVRDTTLQVRRHNKYCCNIHNSFDSTSRPVEN